ncbi:MAG TPA: ABC transporter substrate-binding protein [Candidatus Lustribacter sp.]
MIAFFRLFRTLSAMALAVSAIAAATPGGSADPYEITTIIPLTGGGSFLGKSQAQSLQAVETLVNKHGGIKGRPIHFLIKDDQSSPQVAVQLTNAALAEKPPVLLGSSISAMCNAMTAIVKTAGPTQYCFSPGIRPVKGSYTFSSSVSVFDLAIVGLRYLKSRGLDRVAIITSTDASGQDGEHAFDAAAQRPELQGLHIVEHAHFNPSDVSVSAQMAEIKASKPDVIVAWSTGTPFGTLLRGILNAGIDVPTMGGNGNATYQQMAQYKSILPKELLFPSPRFIAHDQVLPGPIRDAQDLFFNAFKAVGIRPDIAHSESWDPALIFVDALRHVGTNATAEQVRAYIANLHGFTGINGIYDFRDGSQRGLTANSAIVVRWNPKLDTWVGVSGPGGYPRK